MPRALVALGSNLGDRQTALERAVAGMADGQRVRVAEVSSWLETAPVGGPPGQAPFLNGAVALDTTLEPGELLARLCQIEAQAGRARRLRWDARTLDLDLLLYDERISEEAELVLPHPRLVYRRFVLEPAAQVAADWVHPTSGWTIGQLRDQLREAPPWVVVTGDPGSEPGRLVADLAALLPIECGPAVPSVATDGGEVDSRPEPGGPSRDWELEFPERCRRFWTVGGAPRLSRMVVTPWEPRPEGSRWARDGSSLAGTTDDSSAGNPVGPLLILWLRSGGSAAELGRRRGSRDRLPAPLASLDLVSGDGTSWKAIVAEAQAALEATGRLAG